MDLDKLVELCAAMNREGVEYILFGGAAVNLHGIFRVTEDFDFFVTPAATNVAAIKRALKLVWPDPEIDEIRDDDMLGEYPSVRYCPPGDETLYIDFVSRLGEMFTFADLESETHVVEGVPIRLATPATLDRMKRGTVRYKDRDDAARLRRKFNLPEE
ncbi:MAG TPA: hypothetical protein VM733_18300 [Thermoanaerobaculia bacterium]|nr:hypothetical protein [Thermoanaerobaculia bacterium]